MIDYKMKQENYIKGMVDDHSVCIFLCMYECERASGRRSSIRTEELSSVTLVAAVFAAIILGQKSYHPKRYRSSTGDRFSFVVHLVHWESSVTFMRSTISLVADASILNKLSPFFAIIFSFLLLKEKITPTQGACVFLAFIGCLFVVKPGFQNAALVPALIGVCGGLGAGVAYTMVRVLGTHGVKGPIIVFYFSVFSCLFVLPYLIFDYMPMTGRQLVTLMMAGLFAAGGQFTITAAYTYAPAGKISIFDYSQIIFATLLGFFLFGEIPDTYSFVGYGLIILASLGMFIYNMKAAKKS